SPAPVIKPLKQPGPHRLDHVRGIVLRPQPPRELPPYHDAEDRLVGHEEALRRLDVAAPELLPKYFARFVRPGTSGGARSTPRAGRGRPGPQPPGPAAHTAPSRRLRLRATSKAKAAAAVAMLTGASRTKTGWLPDKSSAAVTRSRKRANWSRSAWESTATM